MTIEKFIKKTLSRIVIIIILTILLTGIMAAGDAIVNNEIAMGQLENSNFNFMILETYHNVIRPVANGALVVVYIWNIGLIIINSIKFIYIKYKEKTHEDF